MNFIRFRIYIYIYERMYVCVYTRREKTERLQTLLNMKASPAITIVRRKDGQRTSIALKHAPWPEGTVVVVLRSARILVAEAVGDSLCLRADQGTIPVLLFENRNPRPTVPQKHSSTDMDSA